MYQLDFSITHLWKNQGTTEIILSKADLFQLLIGSNADGGKTRNDIEHCLKMIADT